MNISPREKKQYNMYYIISQRSMMVLFFPFFICNCIISYFMRYPIITDEYNTLAEGVFLVGNTEMGNTFQTLYNTGYYGWGYVVLFSAVYNLFGNMNAVYYMALIVNSFLVALVPVFAYRIATIYFSVSEIHSFFIACCVGLYPAYIVYSKYAMNETALLFLVWPLLYILLGFRQTSAKKKMFFSLVLGFLSAYAYAIHGRGIAILCITLLCFGILLSTTKESWFHKAIYLAEFFLIVLMVNRFNSLVRNYIARDFVGQDVDKLKNTTEQFLNFAFFKSLIGPNSSRIFSGFFGQTLYIIVATLGLTAMAVVIYLFLVWKSLKIKQCDSWVLLGTYAVGLMTSTLMMSVLFFSNLYISEAMPRAEYYLYGRYNEMTGGLLVFFVLLFFSVYKDQNKNIITWSFPLYYLLLGEGLSVALHKILVSNNPKLSYTMVIGLVPFAGSDIYLSPTEGSYVKLHFFASLVFLLVAYLIWCKKNKLLCFVCMALFIYSSTYSLNEFIIPMSVDKYNDMQPLAELNNTLSESNNDCLNTVYILESVIPKPRALFAFADFPVRYMENIQHSYEDYAKIEENSLFVSTKDEHLDYIFEEVYRVEFSEFYLWVYGNGLKTQFEDMGYVCDKRKSSIQDSPFDKLVISNNTEQTDAGESLCITAGNMQYGSNIALGPGYYQVDIYGENVVKGTYQTRFNQGQTHIESENIDFMDGHICYYVTIPEYISDMEFLCINNSETPIIISSLVITPILQMSQTSITQAGTVYFRYRYYDISDVYRDFRNYLSINEDCVASWRYYRVNTGGEMIINDLPMPPGESHFTLKGTNIQNADISVFDQDGNMLSVQMEAGKGVIDFYIDCQGEVSIKIHNDTKEYIDFSALEVRWIDPYVK